MRRIIVSILAVISVTFGILTTANVSGAKAHTTESPNRSGLVFMQVTRHGKEVTVQRRRQLICGSNIYIELANDPQYAVIGNGVGNAATITNNNPPLWNVTCPTGGYAFHPVNLPGHCLIEENTNGHGSVISSTDCTVARRVWKFQPGCCIGDWNSNFDTAIVYTSDNANNEIVKYIMVLPNGAWSNWARGLP